MRVSVVINTYNRGRSLRQTLEALRYQTHPDFEVIVVNGPSTDETEHVLADFAGRVRVYDCPDVHLSKSRNIGIDHAAGEIVAFIDDDAIPEPDWLRDLVAAYDSPTVGGAGGLVYDHTGTKFQYRYSVCSRVAVPNFDVMPPLDEFNRPGADPFVYLQGTNCSFRRELLVEIGGFNEEVEYYLDETEVCLRIIDSGHQLRPLDRAVVHHKYLASHLRNHNRIILDPYSAIKNHCCFARRYGCQTRSLSEVLREVSGSIDVAKAGAADNLRNDRMTPEQVDHFLRRMEQGIEVGLRMGADLPRPFRRLLPVRSEAFQPYPTIRPDGKRLAVCYVSREWPTHQRGGIGRFTADLARGVAANGHEVHVITHSPSGTHTIDLEDGVWMHRLPDAATTQDVFQGIPLAHVYGLAANIYHELNRIHANRGLDVVSAPIWLCEGAISALDERWPTVLTLHTTLKTIAEMEPTRPDQEHVRHMVRLEAFIAQNAAHIYANSDASLAKIREEVGSLRGTGYVVPHGVRDVAESHPRQRPADGKIRILYAGRLEPRKGVDVLLDAAARLLAEFPAAELVLAGKDNAPAGTPPYRERLARHPDLAGRVRLTGELSDAELQQVYADCDVFVLPSYFESFGLVLAEAMSYGKPVVAMRAGGMAEIVEEGGNGYLAEPGDAASLAEALRPLLASDELRERMGRCSRQLFVERFSTAVMVRNSIACYRQVTAAHKRGASGVRPKLIEMMRHVSDVEPAVAERAAKLFLSSRFGKSFVDYAGEVRKLWHLPPAEFVDAAYRLLLGRGADRDGSSGFIGMAAAGDRLGVLRRLAESREARQHEVDTEWLEDVCPPVAPATPAPPLQHRGNSALRRVPVLGPALRFVKRVLRAPALLLHVHQQVHELRAAADDLRNRLAAESPESLGERLAALEKQLADERERATASQSARDRRTQWLLAQYAEQLAELRAATQPHSRGRAA
jgi:glycosyltransferase involved in cell wall biosynthesis/GT2 family glycosyltransferase